MQCPSCHSTEISKNGFRGQKQNHRCRACGRQFVEHPQPHRGYSDDVRALCLKMYLNGMGFRAIERVTEIHHTTIISWVQQAAETLVEREETLVAPQVGEVDELQTFVGSKKTRCGFGALSITSTRVS
jgi:transposase-like protein